MSGTLRARRITATSGATTASEPFYAALCTPGTLVGYKRVAVSMKSKKRPSRLPEEWEVIPNTHEGIVTQAQFDIVQRMMTSRRRDKGGSGFDNIFSGILKCADCGYAMRATSANRPQAAQSHRLCAVYVQQLRHQRLQGLFGPLHRGQGPV